MRDTTSPDPSVETLFDELQRLLESPAAPDVEAWFADHPALASELRAMYSGWMRGRGLLAAVARSCPDEGARGLAPGRELGDFRLVRRIGRGAQGTVWEATQLSLGRRVALKLVLPERLERAQTLERFRVEARAGGRLGHPAIASVYGVGEDDGHPWIAQELVPDGRTLHDAIADLRRDEGRGALPADHVERTAALVIEICEGLQVAHEAGIVHRDVKPSNVLLTPEGRPKLTDFGLSLIHI